MSNTKYTLFKCVWYELHKLRTWCGVCEMCDVEMYMMAQSKSMCVHGYAWLEEHLGKADPFETLHAGSHAAVAHSWALDFLSPCIMFCRSGRCLPVLLADVKMFSNGSLVCRGCKASSVPSLQCLNVYRFSMWESSQGSCWSRVCCEPPGSLTTSSFILPMFKEKLLI